MLSIADVRTYCNFGLKINVFIPYGTGGQTSKTGLTGLKLGYQPGWVSF